MRTSRYLILITLVLTLIVPVARYFTVNPEVNACMFDYVDSLDKATWKWYVYTIDWMNHIEPEDSIFNKYIFDHKVWYSQGCIIMSGNLFHDFNNSVYCSITYMIRKLNNPYWDSYELTRAERLKIFGELKADFIKVAKEGFLLNEDEL
jgi:hypothetical protein